MVVLPTPPMLQGNQTQQLQDVRRYHSFTGNRSGGGSYTTAEGKSGSDAYYTHTTTKDGGHTHDLSINNAGGGQAVDIMPPYLVVYMWKRTA